MKIPPRKKLSRSRTSAARVREALQRLSPEHREVLELVFYQGLNQKEIAQVCGCPLGTVKSRLSYAANNCYAVF